MFISFIGYGTTKNKLTIKNITKITVTTAPGYDNALKTTENKNEIADIINYLNDLHLEKTHKNVAEYCGMSYIITVYYSNKKSKEYVHFGNMFFKETGKEWYEISYKEAVEFGKIYNNMGNKSQEEHN